MTELQCKIEAILFASGEPVHISRFMEVLKLNLQDAKLALTEFKELYNSQKRGTVVLELSENYQITTKAEYSQEIRQVLETKKNTPLSNAAMEVLAIVAYNQPVTKSFVEQVRGVESGQIVNSLVEKNLLEEHGRLDVPGKPIAYKTTLNFLKCFGISSINQLPKIPDVNGQITLEEVVEEQKENIKIKEEETD